mmetsp:Transcript_10008/g.16399  ORF Transcript_10008/g.16399 Transcript_10008/m.16399 type:complete len:118 (-) Transcript_10008:973-1326(-)
MWSQGLVRRKEEKTSKDILYSKNQTQKQQLRGSTLQKVNVGFAKPASVVDAGFSTGRTSTTFSFSITLPKTGRLTCSDGRNNVDGAKYPADTTGLTFSSSSASSAVNGFSPTFLEDS